MESRHIPEFLMEHVAMTSGIEKWSLKMRNYTLPELGFHFKEVLRQIGRKPVCQGCTLGGENIYKDVSKSYQLEAADIFSSNYQFSSRFPLEIYAVESSVIMNVLTFCTLCVCKCKSMKFMKPQFCNFAYIYKLR